MVELFSILASIAGLLAPSKEPFLFRAIKTATTATATTEAMTIAAMAPPLKPPELPFLKYLFPDDFCSAELSVIVEFFSDKSLMMQLNCFVMSSFILNKGVVSSFSFIIWEGIITSLTEKASVF